MSIDVLNETTFDLDELELVACSRFVMEQMRVHPGADLCVRLVDEEAMTTLHVQWMDLPGPTDGRADAGARRRRPRGGDPG
jgi:probable rRNA maturation factor